MPISGACDTTARLAGHAGPPRRRSRRARAGCAAPHGDDQAFTIPQSGADPFGAVIAAPGHLPHPAALARIEDLGPIKT